MYVMIIYYDLYLKENVINETYQRYWYIKFNLDVFVLHRNFTHVLCNRYIFLFCPTSYNQSFVLCTTFCTCYNQSYVLCTMFWISYNQSYVLCTTFWTCYNQSYVLCTTFWTCYNQSYVLCTMFWTCYNQSYVLFTTFWTYNI